MMQRIRFVLSLSLLAAMPLFAGEKPERISEEQRALLIRDFVAEFGTAKLLIPRSKDPLEISRDGAHDKEVWKAAMEKNGPAARLGDLIQITKVEFKGNKLVLELNHGIKGGRKWWHRVEVSGGSSRGSTLGDGAQLYAPGGTSLALVFDQVIPPVTSDEVKETLEPILDFTQRSATELYVEKLPPEFQEAIKQKRAMTGMDRDMILLAKGRPDNKYRDFKDGVETEDWIYGTPPGNVTFVTFEDGKVVRIKDSYATVGGEVKTEEVEAPK
jgi:hypothetical protein